MNTKKHVWTLFVLSVALAVILAGCGTGPSPTEQPAATATTAVRMATRRVQW